MISKTMISQQITLQGKITNNYDVEGIHVLNETSKLNTVTNQIGEFEIGVSIGDTLLFSSVKYHLQNLLISEEIYNQKRVFITLEEMINKLDEVVVGNSLTGNLAYDISNINAEETFNFDDVGIPGFKGEPKEKIVPLVMAAFPTNVNLEALYKHASGYYKTLRKKRLWTVENITVAQIIDYYGYSFFKDAYGIPQNRVYNFLLFCVETGSLQSDFKKQNYAGVLDIFKVNSEEFLSRISNLKN